jgi:hypothetical protein
LGQPAHPGGCRTAANRATGLARILQFMANSIGKPFKRYDLKKPMLKRPSKRSKASRSAASAKAWQSRERTSEPAAPPAKPDASAYSKLVTKPEQATYLKTVANQMSDDEKKALREGFAKAQAAGSKSTIVDYLIEQAALYTHAKEGDPRLTTYFSGDTLEKLTKGPLADVIAKTAEGQKTATAPPKADVQVGPKPKIQASNQPTLIGKPHKGQPRSSL